jgi:FkbM family methyltransferase
MTISLKRRVLDRIVFSDLGLRVFPRLAPILKRGYNIIENNDFSPAVNGERWFATLFPSDGVYIDGGYHFGEWTETLLSHKPGARVYAFDPWPAAQKHYDSCSVQDRVTFFARALSNEPGIATFYDFENACNSLAPRSLEVPQPAREYAVEVTTLDIWAEEHGVSKIDLMKLDLEGYDLFALEGAQLLLESGRVSAIVFEYGTGWIGSRRYLGEAAEYMHDMGYQLFKLFNGFLVPFRYSVSHETFAGAMYVALSSDKSAEGSIPVRRIDLA